MKKVLSIALVMMMLLVSCVAVADSATTSNTDDVKSAIDAAVTSGSKPADEFGEEARAILDLYLPAGSDLDQLSNGNISTLDPVTPTDEPIEIEIDAGDTAPDLGVAVVVIGDAETGFTCIPIKTKISDGKVTATLSPAMQQKLANGGSIVLTTLPATAVKPISPVVPNITKAGTSDPKLAADVGTVEDEFTTGLKSKLTDAIVNGDADNIAEALNAEDAIAALLPEGVDVDDLTMNELVPITVDGAANGTTKLAVSLPTQYDDDTDIVAVAVANNSDGTTTAIPLAAKVVDGNVVIDLTTAAVDALGANGGAIAFLND